jgi:hypothetical protein
VFEVGIAPENLALAFGQGKIRQTDPQRLGAANFAPANGKIVADDGIPKQTPSFRHVIVEQGGMHALHLDTFVDNVVKKRGVRLHCEQVNGFLKAIIRCFGRILKIKTPVAGKIVRKVFTLSTTKNGHTTTPCTSTTTLHCCTTPTTAYFSAFLFAT